jgi:hypothetical protein
MNNPIFFTMEQIKLVLSEFADVTDSKIINSPTTLDDKDFLKIDLFMNELEKINKSKQEEDEYLKLLEKYNALIEKVSKLNMGINEDIVIEENKENNSGVNESNKN